MITYQTRLFLFLILGLAAFSFSSCKKDKGYDAENDVRDSAYIKAKDFYLWTEKLPTVSSFRARNSSDIYDVMDRVRSYQPLDKWSFAETKAETAQTEQGLDSDFGFLVKFVPGSNTEIRVSYVYVNSSAGQAGVQRAWRLNKINGKVINRTVSADIDYINDIFFGNPQSAVFEFIKPDGNATTVTLQKKTYALNTVLYSNVYTRGDRKIGYFVFNEFSGDNSVTELVNTFSKFQNQGVNEVVVDLRYNRGGYVTTQDTLANMLAPKSVGYAEKVMYSYVLNKKYSFLNESYKFHKVGSLDLNRVVFIVSPSSASASELLINNLRPVMNVKLVGDTRTYGKPVGFFPVGVFEYNIYPVSFKTVNSRGEADFFSGFPVDKQVADDLTFAFGDENEPNLKQAINYLVTGGFLAAAPSGKIASVSAAEVKTVSELNIRFADHLPAVTIENRPSRIPEVFQSLRF